MNFITGFFIGAFSGGAAVFLYYARIKAKVAQVSNQASATITDIKKATADIKKDV